MKVKQTIISILFILFLSSLQAEPTIVIQNKDSLFFEIHNPEMDSLTLTLASEAELTEFDIVDSLQTIRLEKPLFENIITVHLYKNTLLVFDTLYTIPNTMKIPELIKNEIFPYSISWSDIQDSTIESIQIQIFPKNNSQPTLLDTLISLTDTSLCLPKISDNIGSIYIKARYHSILYWSYWSKALTFNLDSLNTAPVWLEKLHIPSKMLNPATMINIPLFSDLENQQVDSLYFNFLLVDDSLTKIPVKKQYRTHFQMNELFPGSIPDDKKWTVSLQISDNRQKKSSPLRSPVFYYNKVNNPPEKITDLVPKNGETITQFPITFTWPDAIDPDYNDSASTLSYDIKITSDSLAVLLLKQFKTSPGSNSYRLESGLRDDKNYYIHIKAMDKHYALSSALRQSFYLDVHNNAPQQFSIYQCPDTVNSEYIFKWEKAFEQNKRDSILTYTLHLYDETTKQKTSLSIDFDNSPGAASLSVTDSLKNHHRYQLYIKVKDAENLSSQSINTLEFIYDTGENTAPPRPIVLFPVYTKELTPKDTLKWKPVLDTELDSIFYSVEFSETTRFDSIIHTTPSLSEPLLCLNNIQNYLKDNQWIFWRVRAYDSWGGKSDFSNIYDFYFNKINEAPYWCDEQVFPENEHQIQDTLFTISWSGICDPDFSDTLSTLSFEVEFSDNKDFSNSFIHRSNHSFLPEQSIFFIENEHYYYRIKATDKDNLSSQWSAVHNFYINTYNEAPHNSPDIVYPPPYKALPILGQIVWKTCKDPDPFDTLSYSLKISNSQDFSEPIMTINNIQKNLMSPYSETFARISSWKEGTHLIPKNSNHFYHKNWRYIVADGKTELAIQLNLLSDYSLLKDNHLYYVHINCRDKFGKSAPSSNIIAFYMNTQNQPPSAVSAFVYPRDSLVIKNPVPTFFWKPTKDPDPLSKLSDIRYIIEISQGSNMVKTDTTHWGITAYTYPKQLRENAHFRYRIKALDQYYANGAWSKYINFWLNEKKEAPRIEKSHIVLKDSTIFNEPFPEFKWEAISFSDPFSNQEDFSFEVQISFPGIEEKRLYIIPGNSVYSFRDSVALIDNSWAYYSMRVITEDSLFSDWTPQILFGTDLYPDMPKAFSLLKPKFGQDTLSSLPKFSWEKCVDPDLNDTITYTLYISKDSTFFENNIIIPYIRNTVYELDYDHELLDEARYFWKVAAEDKTGHIMWGSQSNYSPFWFNVGMVIPEEKEELFFGKALFYPIHPNPFSERTTLRYYLPELSYIHLTVYNLMGQRIATLYSGTQTRGEHRLVWLPDQNSNIKLSAGMYVFVLKTGRTVIRQKGIMIR